MTTVPARIPAPPATPEPSLPHAFGGVWRLTYPKFLSRGHLLALAGALGALALLASAYIGHETAEERYVLWIGKFYATFLVPVMAFITAGGAIRDDLKSGTVDYVLTRPVQRPLYLLFKYVAQCAAMQVEYLLALGVLVAVGAVRGAPPLWSALPALWFAQALLVAAFSAFGFLLGVLTSRYVIIGLLYGAVVEVGVGLIPTQLNRLSISHQVQLMLQAQLDATTSIAGAPDAGADPLATTAVTIAFAAGSLALAAVFFSIRELAAANDA